MEFSQVLKNRASVRKFKPDMVEKEKIDAILEAGRICPTAKNAQPQRVFVLTKEEDFEKLGMAKDGRFNAPVVLLVCSDRGVSWESNIEPGYNTWEMDGSIAMTYMMLEATNQGLGSCWVRRLDTREIKKNFNLPSNYEVVSMMPIGYATDDYEPSPRHKERNPIDNMVVWL